MCLVSVIIPVYNCFPFLDECLQSILHQTYRDIEVLVCDDASGDGSLAKLKQYAETDKRIRLFQNDTNIGVSATRNKLINEAKGEYLVMQDADDYSAINRIQLQLDYLLVNPTFIGCSVQFQKVYNGKVVYTSKYPMEWSSIKAVIPEKLPWICAGLMIKKSTVIHYGGYQNIFSKSGFEDHYLIASVVMKEPIANLSHVLYTYRYNPASITKSFRNPNVEKIILNKLGYFLLTQQVSSGTDYLIDKNWMAIEKLLEEFRLPYQQDPSLLYREMAGKSWYWNERWTAILLACRAIINNPMLASNVKLLLYFMKRAFKPKQLVYEG